MMAEPAFLDFPYAFDTRGRSALTTRTTTCAT